MIKFSRFLSCTKTPPKKDGDYLVIRFRGDRFSYASGIHYTVKYGWNTYADNESCHNPIDFSDGNYLWTLPTKVPDKKKTKTKKR